MGVEEEVMERGMGTECHSAAPLTQDRCRMGGCTMDIEWMQDGWMHNGHRVDAGWMQHRHKGPVEHLSQGPAPPPPGRLTQCRDTSSKACKPEALPCAGFDSVAIATEALNCT